MRGPAPLAGGAPKASSSPELAGARGEPRGCGSMDSGAAGFPLRSWHPHVYAKPPKSPTPHSIAHILGIRTEPSMPPAVLRPSADQPLNLSCTDAKRSPASPPANAVSSPAQPAAGPTTSPLPALVAPSLRIEPHDTELALTVRGIPKGASSGPLLSLFFGGQRRRNRGPSSCRFLRRDPWVGHVPVDRVPQRLVPALGVLGRRPLLRQVVDNLEKPPRMLPGRLQTQRYLSLTAARSLLAFSCLFGCCRGARDAPLGRARRPKRAD